jgi:hypothetical protein
VGEDISDPQLAAKNREAWNRWMAAGRLSDKQCADLQRPNQTKADLPKLPETDLAKLTEAEQTELCKLFAARVGRPGVLLPDPDKTIDFSDTQFESLFDFGGLICVKPVKFEAVMFSKNILFTFATFFEESSFIRTTFSGDAYFDDVQFTKGVFFYFSELFNSSYFNYDFS